jgi:hypothetical protein
LMGEDVLVYQRESITCKKSDRVTYGKEFLQRRPILRDRGHARVQEGH